MKGGEPCRKSGMQLWSEVVALFSKLAAQALKSGLTGSLGGMGKQHHEFFTAIAGQQVRLAQALAGDTGKPGEDLVATVMAVVIVDLLEMVQIDNRQVQRRVVAVGEGELFFQPFQKMAAVIQPGEIIAYRNSFQAPVGITQVFPLIPDPVLQVVDISPPYR